MNVIRLNELNLENLTIDQINDLVMENVDNKEYEYYTSKTIKTRYIE